MNCTVWSSPERLSSVIAEGLVTSRSPPHAPSTPVSRSTPTIAMLRVCCAMNVIWLTCRFTGESGSEADVDRRGDAPGHRGGPRVDANVGELAARVVDSGEVHFRVRAGVVRLPEEAEVVRG